MQPAKALSPRAASAAIGSSLPTAERRRIEWSRGVENSTIHELTSPAILAHVIQTTTLHIGSCRELSSDRRWPFSKETECTEIRKPARQQRGETKNDTLLYKVGYLNLKRLSSSVLAARLIYGLHVDCVENVPRALNVLPFDLYVSVGIIVHAIFRFVSCRILKF